MLDAALKAFFARYNSTDGATLRAALPGGLHLHKAPQAAAVPYAVFFTVHNTNKDTFTEDIHKIMFQVNVFGATAGAVTGILEKFRTLYKDKAISATGIKPATLLEGAIYGPFPPTEDGGEWQVGVEFVGLVEEVA